MWTSINLMCLNTQKCKCMLLTNKRNSDHPPLLLNNQNFEQVKQYKYLGVTIFSNLHWSALMEQICKSARKKLGIIYRNFSNTSSSPHDILQLYLSLVHPSLEYVSQVWDPHSLKDVKVLENIQTFALRIATKQYYERYDTLLDTFQLPSLANRRSFLSLCKFFSIVNDFVYFPPLEGTPKLIQTCHPHRHHHHRALMVLLPTVYTTLFSLNVLNFGITYLMML